jgi:large subunit ribosomal protein L2
MELKKLKPTSNGIRHQIVIDKSVLTKKSGLVKTDFCGFKRSHGRSSITGHITSWHKGGGCKKVFSTINFSNQCYNALVVCVIYDSFRNALVNLNFDLKKKKFFKTLATEQVFPGSLVESSPIFPDYRLGYRTQLGKIPAGSFIHNVSTNFHRISTYIRAAGTSGQIIQKDSISAKVKMPSGKVLVFPSDAIATVGTNTNAKACYAVLGKAGKNRLRGKRPTTRGIAMNPVDHPHGGRANGGCPSVTPWGLPTKCGFYLKRRKRYV